MDTAQTMPNAQQNESAEAGDGQVVTYEDCVKMKKRCGLQNGEIAKFVGAKGVNPAIVSLVMKGGRLPSPEALMQGVKNAYAAKQAELNQQLGIG